MASPLDNFLNRQTSVLTGGESNDLIDGLLRSSRITPYKPTALAQADRVRKMNEAANAADGGFLKKAFGALGKTAMYGLNTLGETSRAIGLGVGNLVAPALESGFGLEKGSLRFDINGDGDNTNDNILTGLRDALSPNSRVIGFGETDLLRVQDDDSGAMRWAKYIPAFGLDVATDPLTYVTAGAGTLGRTAAAKAAGDAMFAIGRKAGAEGAEAAATKIAKEALAEAGDEVIKKQATSMLARNRDKVFRYATKEGLDADTAVDQLVSKLGKDDLVELAAEELGIKAQGAYRRGQTRALRRELGNALESEELGTKLFRQLPDNIQGGIRFGGNKITGRNSGGGQFLERFGAKGDKVGDLIERGVAARNRIGGRALPSFGETGFLVKQAKVGAAAARKDASKVAAQETVEGAIRGVAKGKAVAAATGQRLAQKAAEGALAEGQGFKEFGQEYLDEATIAFNQRNMKQYAEEVLAEGSTASPAKKRATQDVMRMVAQQEQEFATNLGRFGDEFSQVEALTDTQRRVLTEEAQRRLRQMGGDGRAEGRLRNFVERTGKFQDPETGEWLSPQEANAMWRAEGNDFDLFETDPFKVHMQTLGRMKRAAEGAARFDGLASVGADVRDIEDAPLSFETLVKDVERSLLDPTVRAANQAREQARLAANPDITDFETEALTAARRLNATEENEALLRDEIQKLLDERNAVTAEKSGVKKREEEAALRAKRRAAKEVLDKVEKERRSTVGRIIRESSTAEEAEAGIAEIAADLATRRSEALMQIDAIDEQLAEAAARRAETMKGLTNKEGSLREKADRRIEKLNEMSKARQRAAQAQARIDKRNAKGAVKAEEILSGAKDIFEQEEMLGKLMREAAIMDPDTRTRVMAQLIENLKKAKQADVQRADAKVKNLEQLAKEEAGNPEIGDLVDQLHAAERRKLAAERNLRRFEVGVDPSKSEFNKAVASGTWMRAGTRVKNGKTITDDVVGAFRGSWVNATIADGINQMIRLEDSRFAETAWMSAYTEFEKLWRTYATVGRGPSFITRNILGGIYNASIAGTTPADLVLGRRYASAVVSARKEAVQRLESGALPALEEESFLDSVLRERLSQEPWRDGLSLWDMHQEMQLRGHFNTQSSLATDRDMMSISEYVKGAKREVLPNIDRDTAGVVARGAIKAADFGANNRWVRTMGTWSQNSELFLRAAVFEAGARKYGSDRGGLAMADALVKASQFDYSDLAPWERKMVGFVAPFWVWTRNNVPLQFRSFAARPGVPNAVLTANEYASEYFGDPNAEDANDFAPKFVRGALGFAGLRPGDDSKSPVYYGIGAPLSDITKFIPEDGELRGKSLMAAPFAALQSLGEDGVAQLNPFIKTAVEGITDVNLFTGAKFNDKQNIADIERYIPFIDARTNAEGELIGSGQARQTFRNLLPGIAQAQRISGLIPGINQVTATQADRDRMLTTATGPLLGLSGLPFLAPMATATESSVNAEIMRQDDLLRAELTKMAERNGVDPEIVLELIGKVPAERIAELIQTGSL